MSPAKREIGQSVDRLANFRFGVEIEGVAKAAFTEFSGLQAEVEVMSYEEGGCNDYVHQRPGRAKLSNVTLKRGMVDSDDVWLWFKAVLQGKFERKNISVILYDQMHNESKRWNLFRAYPVKWVGPAFNVGENTVAIETLELAHEGVELA